MLKRHSTYIGIATLLALMFVFEITSSLSESQTVDEGTHLGAGYSYLMQNDFRLNREHPPLIKELSALPLVMMRQKLEQPFETAAWAQADQWRFAKELIYFNSLPADTILLLGRLPIMLLSLLLGWYLFKWTRELFGTPAAFVALTVYAFSPNLIAHSRYITTDVAMTAFFYITIYYFYKYLKFHRTADMWLTAVFFAVAQASKFSAVFLLPILMLLYMVAALQERKSPHSQITTGRFFSLMGALVLTSTLLLFIVYGFHVTRPIDDPVVQRLLTQRELLVNTDTADAYGPLIEKIIELSDPDSASGKIIYWVLEHARIPFYPYFDGLVAVYFHNYFGHTAYLLGAHTEFGWWYYFPLAILVKTPTPVLLGLAGLLIGATYWLARSIKFTRRISATIRSIPFAVYCLTLPPLFHLGISMDSSLNLGLRHVLVIYPFFYMGIGWLSVWLWRQRHVAVRSVVIIGGAWYLTSSVLIYPYYLAYFNEISGGPDHGSRYLVDSNIDWGQDAKRLKTYMTDHDIPHVCLAYFGQAELVYYDVDYRYLPDTEHFTSIEDVDCVVAISVTALLSKQHEYGWLEKYTPDAKIGYSIFIYDFRRQNEGSPTLTK